MNKEILSATAIGKIVNGLRKSSNKDVKPLAKVWICSARFVCRERGLTHAM